MTEREEMPVALSDEMVRILMRDTHYDRPFWVQSVTAEMRLHATMRWKDLLAAGRRKLAEQAAG